jgi:hypothetical protein
MMDKDEKKFVEMPTLTMMPARKKGLPKGVIILSAGIMIVGLIFIVVALIASA